MRYDQGFEVLADYKTELVTSLLETLTQSDIGLDIAAAACSYDEDPHKRNA